MSDFDTPPAAGAALTREEFDAALSSHDALNADLRAGNKAVLFAALAAAGISHVTVAFDGYGDQGQIESVAARAGDDAVDLPNTTVAVRTAEWGKPEPVAHDMPVNELIERLAYDYLGDTHGGWKNGDGAFGEFVFDIAEGTIMLDHNDRYVAVESSSHTF